MRVIIYKDTISDGQVTIKNNGTPYEKKRFTDIQ